MAYGIIKVDTVTFTDGGIDKSVSISGLVQNPTFSGNVTVTGTISGVTVTGTTANFVSGVFSSQLSGTTVTGTTASFTSGVFTNISGGTHTITSGVFAAGSAASPSISFASDPNTGIYSPGADQVALSTNGTGRLFVDSSGKVGLNQSTFAANNPALHIRFSNAKIYLEDIDDVGNTSIDFAGASGIRSTIRGSSDASPFLAAEVNGSERLRITSAGLVGIGTSSPGALLHLGGNTDNTVQAILAQGNDSNFRLVSINKSAANVSGGEVARFGIRYATGADDSSGIQFFRGNSSAEGHLGIYTGGTTRVYVAGVTGNVGIGTTSPGRTLDVAGTIRSTTGVAELDNATQFKLLSFHHSGTRTGIVSYDNTNNWIYINAEAASSQMLFGTAGIERCRLDSSGRLLVGTSSARGNFVNTSASAAFQVEGLGNGRNVAFIGDDNSIDGAYLILAKQRSGSVGGNTIVQSGDIAGSILFEGSDGTEFVDCASIQAFVDGTPGANDMPGRLVFSVTADGAASPTERLRITSAGLVGIGTSSPGESLDVIGSTIARPVANTNSESDWCFIGGITFDSTPRVATGIYVEDSVNNKYTLTFGTQTDFSTGITEKMRLTSAGRLGIGTTSPSELLHVAGNARIGANDTSGALLEVGAGATGNRNAIIDLIGDTTYTDFGLRIRRQDSGANSNSEITHRGTGELQINAYDVAPIAFFTGNVERARIDSSGRLLVGTSSSVSDTFGASLAQVSTTDGNVASFGRYSADAFAPIVYLRKSRGSLGAQGAVSSGDGIGALIFTGSDGTGFIQGASIAAQVDGTPGANDMPGRLVFSTTADGASSPTERMRITNNGYSKHANAGSGAYDSTTGAYHEFVSDGADNAVRIKNTNATPYGLRITHTTDSNALGNEFLACFGAATLRAAFRSNGGLANYSANNANLSDRNAKKDISLAADTWDCLKQWEIVNYRYKDQSDDADLNLGVIAQQVAESCPEVITVFEEAKDDQPEKLGVKEQQMYWMAIKALQEAQVRIEALEAEVAALKAS